MTIRLFKQSGGPAGTKLNYFAATCCAVFACAAPLQAHPHVFVDGGVDFILSENNMLEALQVTWVYDAFETLYILSSYEMSQNEDGGLDEETRQKFVQLRSTWPSDFDGSAHLFTEGERVDLKWPSNLDAHLIDGKLQLTFRRALETPLDLSRVSTRVAFYESTYFYAFSITKEPQLLGVAETCSASVTPFNPDIQDLDLKAALAKLGREETPENDQVGALFADRISVTCA